MNQSQNQIGGGGSNARGNILSNKALAYLNSKKANSILKSYEEAISTSKYLANQSKGSGQASGVNKRVEANQSNISYAERGRSSQKSRGGPGSGLRNT